MSRKYEKKEIQNMWCICRNESIRQEPIFSSKLMDNNIFKMWFYLSLGILWLVKVLYMIVVTPKDR